MPAPVPKLRRHFSDAQRSAILDQTLMRVSASGFVRIESRQPTWAVVVSGQPVNNVLHAILTLFMCGLWLPVWLILAATGVERRNTISVDESVERRRASRGGTETCVHWAGRVDRLRLLRSPPHHLRGHPAAALVNEVGKRRPAEGRLLYRLAGLAGVDT
jgi:hypothetical protein